MADTFAVSFVACLLAAIVFFNGYSMWNSVKWKLRNKFFPVQYDGVGCNLGPNFDEITKMHEARSELELAILDLKPDNSDNEQPVLKLAHAYRALISEHQERQIRSMRELRETIRKSSAARTRIK